MPKKKNVKGKSVSMQSVELKDVKKKSASTQSVELKDVKKKLGKKSSGENCCEIGYRHHCNIGLIKFSSMAFILFLVTVWPTVGNALLRLHWGWYLGIFVVLGAGAMSHYKSCCKK